MEILHLNDSDTYRLQAEKVTRKWWLELIEKSTGLTWIIYCDTKKHAQACFKGMTCDEARAWMDRLRITPIKMYKTNVFKKGQL